MLKSVKCGLACLCLAIGATSFAQNAARPTGEKTGDVGAKAQAIELNREAEQDIQAKRLGEAKALLKRAIQLNPRMADAHENLALLLLLQGDDAAAETTALEVLALEPDNYNGRLVAGVAAINRSRFARSASYLGPLAAADASDPLATAACALALQEAGRKTEAAKLRADLSRAPVEVRDALLAAQIFREKRLRLQAEKWLEAIIKSDSGPASPEVLYMLAGMYTEQRRLAEASALYTRVLEASPDNFDALVDLSEVERELGEPEKSAAHLYAAKKLAAGSTVSLLHFSQVCAHRHMYVDARDALQKVIAEDSRNREAWYQLGLAQFRIGEPQAAEEDFRTALRLSEHDEWSRVGLGAVLMSSGRQAEAAAEFHRVLEENSKCAAAHYYLGEIDREKGELNSAVHELEQAVNYARRDARPWAALGRLQLAQHHLGPARLSLQKAIDLDPASATAHYYMAMLLRESGETEAAKKEIERFSESRSQEKKKGIVGLVSEGKWDYAGFLPAD